MNNILAIIPARYGSTRFPGKPLALLAGKPLVQHVYEHASEVFRNVVVATDDSRIAECVKTFGGKVVLTSDSHRSGTERCAEAYEIIAKTDTTPYDWVINIQGDEPFAGKEQFLPVTSKMDDSDAEIITLACLFAPHTNIDELDDPDRVKVVISNTGRALYFSRNAIPYLRGVARQDWPLHHTYYQHIGIYAYRPRTLQKITALPESAMEKAESLEQLRWLEAGVPIHVALTLSPTIGIDTPNDLLSANLTTNNLP